MNDLHGHLEPPSGSNGVVLARADDPLARGDGGSEDPHAVRDRNGEDPLARGGANTGQVPLRAGGLAYVATHLGRLRAEVPTSILVHAGDLTGATPLASALFEDAPPVEIMSQLGLRYNAVGNHEFDHGVPALRRLQERATFTYLAANVALLDGSTLFPAHATTTVGGERIAFIGLTLEGTPDIVAPHNLAGVAIGSEVQTVNALVPGLRAAGASAIVVLLHQGASPVEGTTYDGCGLRQGASAKEPLMDIVAGLDAAVDVVVTAHTHRAYVCELAGKLVTSAASYGRVITAIDLTFDAGHRLIARAARNVPVTHDVPADPSIAALVRGHVARAAPRAGRVVGRVTRDLLAHASPSGESNLGDFIADAMLAATAASDAGGAAIAFMNRGGIRGDIRVASTGEEPAGAVTFGELYAVQPFGNALNTVTMTGADLALALEEQFGEDGLEARLLQPSDGLTYAFDRAAPPGQRVVSGTLRLRGVPIDRAKRYRVTVSDFLYNGGDGTRVFRRGTELHVGPNDIEALEAYFASFGPRPARVFSPDAGRLRDLTRRRADVAPGPP